jgi:antitoxin component of RelBE/YafQ-DinJ toxin-antitoxin module
MTPKHPDAKATRFLTLRCSNELHESVAAVCRKLDITPSQFTRQSLAHALQLIAKRENLFT